MHLVPIMSGPQHSTIELFKLLPRDRYELHVVMSGPGEFQEELERRGVTVHFCPSLTRGISLLPDLRALRELVNLFRTERFDLVHTHSSKTGILGRVAARSTGVPVIVHHVRGFAFHEFSGAGTRIGYSVLEAVATRLCDRVIFVNDEEREWAARNGVVPRSRSCTIYNGADLSVFCPDERARLRGPAREEFGIGADQLVVGFIGRLWEQKNPQVLVPTLVELIARFPQLDPVLLIAGDGAMRDDLVAAARAAGVEERLRLLGWRNDVVRAMSASDVIYLPSLWEGLPRTLIEASCLGVPGVASDVKGNREVIVDAKTGRLVAPRDVVAAASALGELLVSCELLSQMGDAAAERAHRIYDARETARKVEEIYADLLA